MCTYNIYHMIFSSTVVLQHSALKFQFPFWPVLRNPGDEVVANTDNIKIGHKGDCLSIAKKLALLKEFEEVKASGIQRPNKDTNSTYQGENSRPPFNICIYIYILHPGSC